ncbi:MAG: hypothetical protein BWY31_03159 [Lentisphaerae bacterium ADurb.Bin242]|nr:MAG: hypothetical protein BWY31_03159 [Lentisphaerae bacterium ADurb.Bin242]
MEILLPHCIYSHSVPRSELTLEYMNFHSGGICGFLLEAPAKRMKRRGKIPAMDLFENDPGRARDLFGFRQKHQELFMRVELKM